MKARLCRFLTIAAGFVVIVYGGTAMGVATVDDGVKPYPPMITTYRIPPSAPPIFRTLIRGDLEKLREELAKSPELNVRTEEGLTPLIMTLIGRPPIEKMRLLLQAGADANFPDGEGNTPLYYALRRNQLEAANLLLAHGAKIQRLTAAGHSALRIATEFWMHDLIFPLLTKGADFRENFRYGGLLHYAASRKDRTLIEWLLQQGESIDRIFPVDGTTPLMAAVRWGDDSAVRAILEFHPQVDLQDNAGWSALMYAIALDKRTIVTLLLDQKADVKLSAKDGVNAYLLAGRRGFSDLQELALEAGATAEKIRLPDMMEKLILLAPAQRLALAMAAYELYLHGEEIDSLAGNGEVARRRVQSLLFITYGMRGADALKAKISFYFEKGERAEQVENAELARMTEAEFRAKLLTLLDDPVKINVLRTARKMALAGGDDGALAWDLCHHNALVILGVRAGWISEEDAWPQLTAAAGMMREKCKSWDVVAAVMRSKLGATYYEPKRAEAMLQLFTNKMDTNSPWARVPLSLAKE